MKLKDARELTDHTQSITSPVVYLQRTTKLTRKQK